MNPLWWVHLRIGGDARQPLWLAGGYVALLLIFVGISFRMADVSAAQVASIWVAIIGGVQALLTLIAAPNTIHKAVQRDFQNGMMESLRLTPLSGQTLALGYLFGPPLALMALFLIGLLAGTTFVGVATTGTGLRLPLAASVFVGGWFALQGLLLMMFLFVGSLMLLSAVGSAGSKFNLFGFIVAGAVFGGWVGLAFLPGLSLLVGLLDAQTLFTAVRNGAIAGELWRAMAASGFHLAFALLFVIAAARKLRRPDQSLFSMRTATALLALWVAAGLIGRAMHATPTWLMNEFSALSAVQAVATAASALLLSLFLTNAAAVERLRLDRAAQFAGPPVGRRSLGLISLLTTGLLTLLALGGLWRLSPDFEDGKMVLPMLEHGRIWVALAVAVTLSAWMDASALYLAHARRWRVWVVVLLLWGVYKVGLLMSDGASISIMQEAVGQAPPWRGWLTAASPLGALLLLVFEFPERDSTRLLIWGLAPQAAIALGLHLLAVRARAGLAVRKSRIP